MWKIFARSTKEKENRFTSFSALKNDFIEDTLHEHRHKNEYLLNSVPSVTVICWSCILVLSFACCFKNHSVT